MPRPKTEPKSRFGLKRLKKGEIHMAPSPRDMEDLEKMADLGSVSGFEISGDLLDTSVAERDIRYSMRLAAKGYAEIHSGTAAGQGRACPELPSLSAACPQKRGHGSREVKLPFRLGIPSGICRIPAPCCA